ncbi:hypothetical protein HYW44_01450 [Candidatus Daviesbacteria bacterium]|nr:hypothetical protein [Candidatus Daviesbacteria bacterium]
MTNSPESENEPPENPPKDSSESAKAVVEAERILFGKKLGLQTSSQPRTPNANEPSGVIIPTLEQASATRGATAYIRGEKPSVTIDIHEPAYRNLIPIANALYGKIQPLANDHAQESYWNEVIASKTVPRTDGEFTHVLSTGMDNGCLYWETAIRDGDASGKLVSSSRISSFVPGANNGQYVTEVTFVQRSAGQDGSLKTGRDPKTAVEIFAKSYSEIYPSFWQKVKTRLQFWKKNN